MKAIEEAAKEAGLVNRMAKTNIEEAFKKGVAFAQRWIPVDEELPKDRLQVLCKGDGFIEVLTYNNQFGDWESNVDMEAVFYVTYWRPI